MLSQASLVNKPRSLRLNEPLKKHSYIGIGGFARYFFEPCDETELLQGLEFLKTHQIPYRFIGGGCNVLFSDQGFLGCIISMKQYENDLFCVDNDSIRVGAGMKNFSFVKRSEPFCLSGMEFLCFIPGTIGGSLVMNAGCLNYTTEHYDEIGDFVSSVKVIRDDKIQNLLKNDVDFSYRLSSLNDKKTVVLEATFKLKKNKINNLKELMSYNFRRRAEKIPMDKRTLGSVFKNPKEVTQSAGYLIEACGLKGKRVGGVQISPQHANIIENDRGGSSQDFLSLVSQVQEAVLGKFKIKLELEIEYISET